MAELRSAEEALRELQVMYESLRTGPRAEAWPALQVALLLPASIRSMDGVPASDTRTTTEDTATSAQRVLQVLSVIRDKVCKGDLAIKMEKFGKRLQEKDPVTDKPRYGEKTQQRVATLLHSYHELQLIVRTIFGEEGEEAGKNDTVKESWAATAADILETLKNQAQREHEESIRAERTRQETEAQARAELERQRLDRERAEQQAIREAQAEQRRQRERVEERARQEMLAQRDAAARAAREDQAWQDSIHKGPRGVREQIGILLDATAHDKSAQQTAINALHSLFKQVVARPEEVNYRRIRRNHPQFLAEIGRHPGGKEVLIAAGFRLGTIDDVPSFISTEPDLEKDMGGWSAWFDLLKETLAIIEETVKNL